MKKDVFISYSRKDMVIADELCNALDRVNISYFIDKQDIGVGHPFAEIAQAIKECTVFVYLGSGNAYKSKYAPKEINFAIKHKNKNSILPYLIDNTPLPDELDFLLCDYNIRTKVSHPIEPQLIDDLLNLLNRKNEFLQDEKSQNPKNENIEDSHRGNKNYAIAEKVKLIIENKLCVDPSEVHDEASFTNDLGADSLDAVELIMEFEKEFGIFIQDEQIESILATTGDFTVGDAISYIESKIK